MSNGVTQPKPTETDDANPEQNTKLDYAKHNIIAIGSSSAICGVDMQIKDTILKIIESPTKILVMRMTKRGLYIGPEPILD